MFLLRHRNSVVLRRKSKRKILGVKWGEKQEKFELKNLKNCVWFEDEERDVLVFEFGSVKFKMLLNLKKIRLMKFKKSVTEKNAYKFQYEVFIKLFEVWICFVFYWTLSLFKNNFWDLEPILLLHFLFQLILFTLIIHQIYTTSIPPLNPTFLELLFKTEQHVFKLQTTVEHNNSFPRILLA